jgi:hypothetical protein
VWQRRIYNLQIPKGHKGTESRPLRRLRINNWQTTARFSVHVTDGPEGTHRDKIDLLITLSAHLLTAWYNGCVKKLSTQKVKITERAAFQRINRTLHKQGENLRTARTEKVEAAMGRHYIIDVKRKAVTADHVDLEKLGRKLGLIEPWEEVA